MANGITVEDLRSMVNEAVSEAVAGVAEASQAAGRSAKKASATKNGPVSLDTLRELFGKEVGKSKRGNPVFETTLGELPSDLGVTLVRGKSGLYAIIPNGTRVTVRKGKLVAAK